MKGQPFVLVGTEGIHRHCASQSGHTVLRRTRAEVERLRRELADARGDAMRLHRDLMTSRDENSVIRNERDNARVRQQAAERLATDVDVRQEREIVRLRGEVISLARERDAARSEAALHQTLANPDRVQRPAERSVQVVAQAQQDAPSESGKDASEIRFSLLELDKT